MVSVISRLVILGSSLYLLLKKELCSTMTLSFIVSPNRAVLTTFGLSLTIICICTMISLLLQFSVIHYVVHVWTMKPIDVEDDFLLLINLPKQKSLHSTILRFLLCNTQSRRIQMTYKQRTNWHIEMKFLVCFNENWSIEMTFEFWSTAWWVSLSVPSN